MPEPSDAVRQAFAEARAALDRPRTPPPEREPRELPEDDPVARVLRQLRASRGFVRRSAAASSRPVKKERAK